MRPSFDPLRLMLISVAGWLSQQQRDIIDYLQEENRVLRQQLGNKRFVSATINVDAWQPEPRSWAVACFEKWPRSSRPIRFWLGTGS